jgi:hypothetical protein
MLNTKDFQGKCILIISPDFFGYEIEIKNILVSWGADVTLVDDRPTNNPVTKGLIRIHKDLIKNTINRYYDGIAQQTTSKQFDIIFLLNPEALSISFLKLCKIRWPNAYYVMYMWDSLKNRKHTMDFLPYCDKVFTFDKNDAIAYEFSFRPLFYLNCYGQIREESVEKKYDLCFMGTVRSDRYAIARNIKQWCDERDLNCFFYFYVQARSLYLFNRLKGSNSLPGFKEVSFAKMSTADVVKIVAASRVVLDIQHPNQTGLTMRTLETLGAGKKLITTNDAVKEYDFYSRERIEVIDRNQPSTFLGKEFFLNDADYSSFEKIGFYSINSWLQDILIQ